MRAHTRPCHPSMKCPDSQSGCQWTASVCPGTRSAKKSNLFAELKKKGSHSHARNVFCISVQFEIAKLLAQIRINLNNGSFFPHVFLQPVAWSLRVGYAEPFLQSDHVWWKDAQLLLVSAVYSSQRIWKKWGHLIIAQKHLSEKHRSAFYARDHIFFTAQLTWLLDQCCVHSVVSSTGLDSR